MKSVDFITPNVDEGYVQGKISAANVTSDVYSVAPCRLRA